MLTTIPPKPRQFYSSSMPDSDFLSNFHTHKHRISTYVLLKTRITVYNAYAFSSYLTQFNDTDST
jgi:hypothetical protein